MLTIVVDPSISIRLSRRASHRCFHSLTEEVTQIYNKFSKKKKKWALKKSEGPIFPICCLRERFAVQMYL